MVVAVVSMFLVLPSVMDVVVVGGAIVLACMPVVVINAGFWAGLETTLAARVLVVVMVDDILSSAFPAKTKHMECKFQMYEKVMLALDEFETLMDMPCSSSRVLLVSFVVFVPKKCVCKASVEMDAFPRTSVDVERLVVVVMKRLLEFVVVLENKVMDVVAIMLLFVVVILVAVLFAPELLEFMILLLALENPTLVRRRTLAL